MEDIRITSYNETITDRAMHELAKIQAACMCRLQYGRCEKRYCKMCDIGARYSFVTSKLNEYDKLRLYNYISEEYDKASSYRYAWAPAKKMRKYMFKEWFKILGFLLLVVALLCLLPLAVDICGSIGPLDQPPSTDHGYHEMIVHTIKVAQSQVYDTNHDGQINCIDYAVTFKKTWDRLYPILSYKCFIVRNYNKFTGMHHLFIYIYNYYGEKVFIEPWADYPNSYDMKKIWGNRYNPNFNIYGETEKWLNTTR